MRILVVAGSIGPSTGGGRVGILGMCIGLFLQGHDVTLITSNIDGNDVMEVPLGVPVNHRGVDILYFPAQFNILGNIFSLELFKALKIKIINSDIALIHSLYQFTSTIASYYCRKYNVPYVLRPHGSLDPFLINRRRSLLKIIYINIFEKKNFRLASAIQYSSLIEEKLAKIYIQNSSKKLIISEGIDINKFLDLSYQGKFLAHRTDLKDKVIFLFLGRIHPKKGIEILLNAFSICISKNFSAHLLLAGDGEIAYVEMIKKKIGALGLSKQVTIMGNISENEKMAVLADADVFVLSSLGENFGIAVVEAMASRLPVIISNKVGIYPDIIENNCGFVVDCCAEKVANAMLNLILNSDLRDIQGNNGYQLVSDKFTLDSMSKKMAFEYSKLCGTPPYNT